MCIGDRPEPNLTADSLAGLGRRWFFVDRTSVAIAVGFLVCAILVWIKLPSVETVFAVSARTEIVLVRVTNPAAATFGLQVARLHTVDANTCIDNLVVSPRQGATVQYARFGLDAATITIDDQPVDLAQAHSKPGEVAPKWAGAVAPPIQLVIDPKASDCSKPNPIMRLPLFGSLLAIGDETIFGNDPQAPRLVLLSGSIRMFVRAIDLPDVVYRLLPKGWLPKGELFAVEQTALPPGSAIHEAHDPYGQPADWWGFVDVAFEDASARGLQVEASSHARSVAVTLPAALTNDPGAEDQHSLSLNFFQRWANDPILRLLALSWAGSGIVLEVARWLWKRRSPVGKA